MHRTLAVPDLPSAVEMGEIMTRDVFVANPDTPMHTVVAGMFRRQLRALPVLDGERRVVGIITNGDLARRGGLPIHLGLLRGFDTPELQVQLRRLSDIHRVAGDVMTSAMVTVHPHLDVRQAAELMCERTLKRLPVVDEDDRLLGIISRADLLCTIARTRGDVDANEDEPPPQVEGNQPVGSIMSSTVPTVHENASMEEVIEAVTSTRLSRAVVIDARRRVIGIITDSELIERLAPHERPRPLTIFRSRVLARGGIHTVGSNKVRMATAKRARDLMRTDVWVAHDSDAVRDVVAEVLRANRKIMPIVNERNELVGMVDRANLLAVLTSVGNNGPSAQ